MTNDLGYSPLQAGLRILPIAAMLGVAAASASITARLIGIKFTAAAALVAIAAGLWQISAASTVTATYGDVLPGLLLIGFGAGLLLPTATNSVVGSVPQVDSGIGSAVNTVALQVGGALGVAVIGSLMLTRYQTHISTALVGRHGTCRSRPCTQFSARSVVLPRSQVALVGLPARSWPTLPVPRS